MLPVYLDDNAPYAIVGATRQGFHIVLASKEMLAQTKPAMPLWEFECGDQRSLNAVAHWCAVRRSQWQEWGEIAESRGRHALAKHMAKLIDEQPIGEVEATIVRAGSDPSVLGLGEMVSTSQGLRTEILYQHRFSSPEKRAQFFKWFQRNFDNGSVETLITLGIREGTATLAEALEELVVSPGKVKGATRRRPALPRKAA